MADPLPRLVAADPAGAAADVDFGMIMGTGFAPFTGGPLRFADYLSLAKVVQEMEQLVSEGHPRFVPCALLQTMATDGRQFYGKNAM